MVLAAGLGERLRPLTETIPKPAIPVLGRPLIVQVLRRLARAGVSSAAINLCHLADRLRKVVDEETGIGLERIDFSFEKTILGTAGGIRQAAPFLRGSGAILVRNADFLCDVDLGRAIATHIASGCLATLVLARARRGYSTIEVGEGGQVLSLGGAPRLEADRVVGRYVFTGLHLIEEEVLDLIPAEGPSDIVRDVYRDLASKRKLGSYVHNGFWWEFGSPLEYLEGSLRLLGLPPEARLPIVDSDPVKEIGGAIVACGPGARFHSTARLAGRISLGFASHVGEGSRVEDSIVLPEAWIGPRCRLRRTIVAPWTEVPSEFEADGVLICPDATASESLPPGTVRSEGLLIRRLT